MKFREDYSSSLYSMLGDGAAGAADDEELPRLFGGSRSAPRPIDRRGPLISIEKWTGLAFMASVK